MRAQQIYLGQRRRRHAVAVGLLIMLAAEFGCGDQPLSPPAEATAESAPAADSPPAKQIDQKHPVLRIDTNLGAITIRLDAEKAPGTVRNFLNYVNERFYQGTIFHFVDPDQMIMGGGYTADYQLKPAHSPIRNEAHNELKNLRGTIAMARSPSLIDSANSQFFINLADAPIRDYAGEDSAETYGYCVFGEVTDGMDVVERISRTPTTDLSSRAGDLGQTPRTPVVISSIQIVM